MAESSMVTAPMERILSLRVLRPLVSKSTTTKRCLCSGSSLTTGAAKAPKRSASFALNSGPLRNHLKIFTADTERSNSPANAEPGGMTHVKFGDPSGLTHLDKYGYCKPNHCVPAADAAAYESVE